MRFFLGLALLVLATADASANGAFVVLRSRQLDGRARRTASVPNAARPPATEDRPPPGLSVWKKVKWYFQRTDDEPAAK